MHSKDFLAQELRAAGLLEMADKAANGYYHDYLSPLETPAVQLAADLSAVGTPQALMIRARHLDGVFDATAAEGEEWAASPAGQAAFRGLLSSK